MYHLFYLLSVLRLRSILKHEENSSISKLQSLLEENGLNVNESVRS